MAALCKIELFGGLQIIRGDDTVSRFRSRKIAALLAFLAYHRHRAHPREALIEMLWPWADPAAGRHSLSAALSSLRHQLEPPGVPGGAVLVADRTTVRLNPDTVSTDVAEFEAALSAAQRATDKGAEEIQLREAARVYRGELLPGLYESWIPPEQVRLSELYVGAVVGLADLLAERGETTEAASHLHRAIEAEPLREEPYRQLIRLNAEQGEPGAALTTYHELERVLAEELGEKPSAATRQLVKEIERLATQAPGAGFRSTVGAPRPTRRRRKVEPPTGTVTFLLIGVDQDVDEAARALREEFKRHGGAEIETQRAGYAVAFGRAGDALSCAATCQLRVAAPDPSPKPLAMAVHTAEVATAPDGAYTAPHRAERLLAAAQPAQILCSEATAGLLRYDLDGGLRLRDLGAYRLHGASASEHVFQLDYPGCPEAAPPLDAEPGYSGHLPYQITRFFGRRQEIERLEAVLTGDARLVTLIGPPGCGKTRLAIEVAKRLVKSFKGNVWFVPLADLSEGSDILDRALDPLGIQRQPTAKPLDQIAASLAEQPSFIVFDNFEHLIESASDMRSLLESLPDLRCLVTSRRRLGLTGEREFPVSPLPVPGKSSLPELLSNDSAQLFVDRAQAVKPDFQLAPSNAETVAALCRRLEGVPLAIELAAARSHTYGLRHLLEQLEKGEDLETRSRDAEDRHRSLTAAVDWSYSLLSPDLQRFFARLSVFRGGWTVESAEEVCDEPLASDYLMQLVELSLVQTDHDARPEPRYHMLEMVRHFATERLGRSGEQASVNDRHCRHFFSLVEQCFVNRRGPHCNAMWLDPIEVEHENLLLALEWSRHAPDRFDNALTVAGKLSDFWHRRGFLALGCSVLTTMLRSDCEGKPTVARARALHSAGVLAFEQGDVEPARSSWSEELEIARLLNDRGVEAKALDGLGTIARHQGDYALADTLHSEALRLFGLLGDEGSAAGSLCNLGVVAFDQADYDSAHQMFSHALLLYRKLGRQVSLPIVLGNLGNIASRKKNYALANSLFEEGLAIARVANNRSEIAHLLCCLGCLANRFHDNALAISRHSESLEISRQLDDKVTIARSTGNLGLLYTLTGDIEQARTHLAESLRLASRVGATRECAYALENAGRLSAGRLSSTQAEERSCLKHQETWERATRLFAAAQGIKNATGATTDDEVSGEVNSLRDALDAPTFEAAWAEGLAMMFDQAIAYALDYLENAKASVGDRQVEDGLQDMANHSD